MTIECPKCGESFKTKQSRGIHLQWCKNPERKNFSEEHKQKISQSLKGQNTQAKTKEHKKKLSQSLKGRNLSENHKKNISKGLQGHSHSEKSKRKMSEAHKGKAFTQETKRKMSKAQKQNWQNEEYRQKIIDAWTAKQTKLEKKAEDIINELELDFEFVGDYSYNIGTKIPDFINEEERKAIEVYSIENKKIQLDLNSIDEYKEPRRKYFNERGWEVYFIPAKTLREDLEELT